MSSKTTPYQFLEAVKHYVAHGWTTELEDQLKIIEGCGVNPTDRYEVALAISQLREAISIIDEQMPRAMSPDDILIKARRTACMVIERLIFGANLKRIRIAKGVKLTADNGPITSGYLSKLENFSTTASTEMIEKLAHALNVSVQELRSEIIEPPKSSVMPAVINQIMDLCNQMTPEQQELTLAVIRSLHQHFSGADIDYRGTVGTVGAVGKTSS